MVYMVKEKSTDELIKELLEKRNHESKNQIEKFINPDYSDFRNPFDFENMEAIVNKIIFARKNKEKIFIYGDYDVDGISGTAFLEFFTTSSIAFFITISYFTEALKFSKFLFFFNSSSNAGTSIPYIFATSSIL